MKKGGRIFIVLFSIVGVIFCLVRFYKHISVKSAIPNKTHMEYKWNEIDLPSDYDWKEKTLTTEDLFDMRAFYDNRYVGNELAGQSGYIVFPSGKYYFTMVEDMETNSFPGQSLQRKVDGDMTKNGWKQGIQYGDYYIMGMAADGPTGSVIGYVKRVDNQLQTIVCGYSVDGTWVESEEGPMQLKCPCKTTMGIFISDPVDLSEVLSK